MWSRALVRSFSVGDGVGGRQARGGRAQVVGIGKVRMERVIGIEPTTFSLGIRSGEIGACEGDGGLGQASEGEESVCDDAGSASCDEDVDT